MILVPLPPPPPCPQTQLDVPETYWTNFKRNMERSSYFCSHALSMGRQWIQNRPPMESFHQSAVRVSIEMDVFLDFLAYTVLPLQSRDRIDLMEQLFVFYEPAILPSPGPPPPPGPMVPPLQIVRKYELPRDGHSYCSPQLLSQEQNYTLSLRRSADDAVLLDVPHALLTALRKSKITRPSVKRLLSQVRPVVSPHLTVPA
jgi:hypothetical protein